MLLFYNIHILKGSWQRMYYCPRKQVYNRLGSQIRQTMQNHLWTEMPNQIRNHLLHSPWAAMSRCLRQCLLYQHWEKVQNCQGKSLWKWRIIRSWSFSISGHRIFIPAIEWRVWCPNWATLYRGGQRGVLWWTCHQLSTGQKDWMSTGAQTSSSPGAERSLR